MIERQTMAELMCYTPRYLIKAERFGSSLSMVGKLETARLIVQYDSPDSQNKLDAISHANESLYLIRSGTA